MRAARVRAFYSVCILAIYLLGLVLDALNAGPNGGHVADVPRGQGGNRIGVGNRLHVVG